MKRIAIKLVVFLLLGAVTTVAVSWGCAIRDASSELTRVSSGSPRQYTCTKPGAMVVYSYGHTSHRLDTIAPSQRIEDLDLATQRVIKFLYVFVLEDSLDHLRRAPARHIERWNIERHLRVGWPLLCLTGSERFWWRNNDYARAIEPRDHISLGRETEILPIVPLLPGFLINTLFYAVILWLLWSAPFATRRLSRKRHGRCVQCGYDLRHVEHDACPECGSVSQRQS